MQLGLSFSVLLASILALAPANAAPIKRDTFVSAPLAQVHRLRADVPMDMQLQQHMNRAHRRLARITGSEIPSDAQLQAALKKRMWIPANAPYNSRKGAGKEKRYSRLGTHTADDRKHHYKPLNKVSINVAAVGDGFDPIAFDAQTAGGLTLASTPSTGNALGLDIEANDIGYISTVQIGTPPKNFNLLMDSGSADLWVGASAGCTDSDNGGACGASHTFLGSESSTFVDTGVPFAVTYGAGNVAGTVVTDTLSIAGKTLVNHAFGVASTESDEFASDATPFDGIMGLAKSALSQQGELTPPEAFASASLFAAPIVSFRLSRLQDKTNNGQVTFGAVDPATIDAATSVTLANVATNGFWEAAMDSITVDGDDAGLAGRTAILDTGTTLIVAPEADATAIHTLIPGAKSDGNGGFVIPCTTTAVITLSFGGKAFAIDPRDMLFAPVDPANLQGDCFSGITSGAIGSDTQWLVGDVFLKNAVFTTDVTANNIQLAKPA